MEVMSDVPSGNSLGRMSSHAWGGWIQTWDENEDLTMRMGSASTDGGFAMFQTAIGGTGVLIDGEDAGDNAGRIAVQRIVGQNVFPSITLDGDAGDGAPLLQMFDGNSERIRLDADGAGGGAGVSLWNSASVNTIELDADEDDHGVIRVFDSAGVAGIELDGGTGMTTTRSLAIVGGADLAEPFNVAKSEGQAVEPGMVVTIDPNNAGRLKLADSPYDRRVAGIISGAKELSPGLVLRAEGNAHADGDHNVALTGRVWCWCDASNAAIVPGDRLTTSTVAGHAMRVAEGQSAEGAVLGKAMTALESGRGLVLVLVSLQ
jgi:hypothetical protein